MAAAPLDLTLPLLYGLRYMSDVTAVSGNAITRTFAFSMVPVVAATASCTLAPGATGSPIDETSVDTVGSGYAAPPIINVVGTSDTPVVLTPEMEATDGIIVAAGLGYHALTTTVVLSGGGLTRGEPQATASVTLGGSGEVTAITVLTPGAGYTAPPTATLIDTDPHPGAGAVISMGLGLSALEIVGVGGVGYKTAPSIVLTPVFKKLFPDGTNQTAALSNFMTMVFEGALNSDVFALVPVIS